MLRKDETAAGQTYKHARVVKVHVGIDGRVRSADIEYRLPGETRYRTTTRPMHKLVMIIPVEEQTAGNSEEKAGITEPMGQELEVVNKTEAEETKSNRPSQAENVKKDDLQGKKEVKGEPTQKVKHKKINSRKKTGKQARTMIIAVPREDEEIKDIGATARQKRGRPRKSPETRPLDPRKGSVLDPGKGVCADPRGGDATLGVGGPGPPMGDNERQLNLDRGGQKT
jgi:hypothetical protein